MTDRERLCGERHPSDKRTCDRPFGHELDHEAWEIPGESRVSWVDAQSPLQPRARTEEEAKDWQRYRSGRSYRTKSGEYVEAVQFTRRPGLLAEWCDGVVVSDTEITVGGGTVGLGDWVIIDSAGVVSVVAEKDFDFERRLRVR